MPHTIALEPSETDQWFVDSPKLSEFVTTAKEIIASTNHNRIETLNVLEPYFAALLQRQDWLPEHFAQANPESGLGGGIGQWLLYRSQELTIFSLVIPPNSITPIHDHLSWGLVGLYQGKQEETVYRRLDRGQLEGFAQLEIAGLYQVKRGDIYHLLPPDGAPVNRAAFAIHSQIHEARPDIVAAAHAHSLYGKSWSSLARLLDPLTQDACIFYQDHALFDDYKHNC